MSLLLTAAAIMLAPEAIEVTAAKQADPMVCTRRRDRMVGSNMAGKRTCKRKSEWALEARETQRDLQALDGRRIDPAEVPPPR